MKKPANEIVSDLLDDTYRNEIAEKASKDIHYRIGIANLAKKTCQLAFKDVSKDKLEKTIETLKKNKQNTDFEKLCLTFWNE